MDAASPPTPVTSRPKRSISVKTKRKNGRNCRPQTAGSKKDKKQIGNQMGDMGNTFYCRVGDLGNTPLCKTRKPAPPQNALSQSRVNGAWLAGWGFVVARLAGWVLRSAGWVLRWPGCFFELNFVRVNAKRKRAKLTTSPIRTHHAPTPTSAHTPSYADSH